MSNTDYPPLNLPAAPLKIRAPQANETRPCVFDSQRRKWVSLTPEEWVRQHFVAMLIGSRGYRAGLIANEVSLTLNGTSRRCDTVVFDSQKRPYMIVEYKAPDVAISQKVFDQIVRYNMVLRARYLVVSNGLHHYCCEIDYTEGNYAFIPEIPCFK